MFSYSTAQTSWASLLQPPHWHQVWEAFRSDSCFQLWSCDVTVGVASKTTPADAPMRGQQCGTEASPFSIVAVAMWWCVGGMCRCSRFTTCKQARAGFQATLKQSTVEGCVRLDGGENAAFFLLLLLCLGGKFSASANRRSHTGVSGASAKETSSLCRHCLDLVGLIDGCRRQGFTPQTFYFYLLLHT